VTVLQQNDIRNQ